MADPIISTDFKDIDALIRSPALPVGGRCALGEGLYVEAADVYWVDILASRLYCHTTQYEHTYDLPVEATVIYSAFEGEILLGSGSGLGVVNVQTGNYRPRDPLPSFLCPASHRSNDGCQLSGGQYLLGTMHKKEPGKYPGAVILINYGGAASVLIEDIHIPNTFIELGDGSVLVTDSYTGTIYQCQFEAALATCNRTVWYQAPAGVAPDGGCRLSGDYIAVAMWDAACIRIFTDSGRPVADLRVPAKRPTNVKYNKDERSLWVTSASEDLTAEDLERYPLSGKTFCIEDPLATLCL